MDLPDDARRRVAVAVVGAALAALVGYAAVQFVASLTFAVFLYYAVRPIYRRMPWLSHSGRSSAAGAPTSGC